MITSVPFLDLQAQHRALSAELSQAMQAVLSRCDFILGESVPAFEKAFAGFIGAEYVLGISNGLDALRLALMALDIGPGDEVILQANTYIATALAVSSVGARPVLVDCEADTYRIAVTQIDSAITPRTRAIMPVHLTGMAADMDPIMELARRRNLHVIEDAAQAQGTRYKGRPCGAIGRIGCFSFYPGKDLGACGEAGAITTNDEGIARFCKMVRDHGQSKKYFHDIEGYNGRLDAIQAGLLSVKLRHLAKWNESRRAHAQRYNEMLKPVADAVVPVLHPEWARSVYHLYVVRVSDRDQLMKDLSAAGIATGIHYPIPLHQLKAYDSLGYQTGEFPVAEKVAGSIVSLPMFAELTEEQQRRVCDRVAEFVSTQLSSASR